MKKTTKNKTKLHQLLDVLEGNRTLLIVLQTFPDPDAIAAASALKTIANNLADINCSITSGGFVSRAENRALVKYLGLNIHRLNDVEVNKFDLIAFVDTQPLSGNNSLQLEKADDIVIDHNPIVNATRSAQFTDIRSKYGATSTILTEYLRTAKITPEIPIATALLYGISSDTQDLGRDTTQADIDAHVYLYPLANKRILSKIQHSEVPKNYFKMLHSGLENATTFGKGLITRLNHIENPDMIAEIADLLLKLEDNCWTLCYGVVDNVIRISLRSNDPTATAGKLMQKIISQIGTGGGHNMYAGGQVSLQANKRTLEELEALILKRFKNHIKEKGTPENKLIINE